MSFLNPSSYRKYRKNKMIRHVLSLLAVVISGFLQAFTLKVFIQPSNLLSSGFLGVSILMNQIAELFGVELSISMLLIMLNIPVAILCYRGISPRFTFYSILQVFVGSFFIRVLNFEPFAQYSSCNFMLPRNKCTLHVLFDFTSIRGKFLYSSIEF